MKKIVYFSFFILVSMVSVRLFGNESEKKPSCFSTAVTAGYVFKHDCKFKEVYGHGMVNIITGDLCYYIWKNWGVGAKASYWRAKGKTTLLQQCTFLQEVPMIVYLRGKKDFNCGLQLYASLGGGAVWTKEKSYLGCARFYKGIGEVELGLNYQIWRSINFTTAVRYLFPPQTRLCEKIDVGGVDLRAGIGFLF